MNCDTVESDQVQALAHEAARLGYKAIIFNVDTDLKKKAVLPTLPNDIRLPLQNNIQLEKGLISALGLLPPNRQNAEQPDCLLCLTRCTFLLQGASGIAAVNSVGRESGFDLIAVQPEDESAFHAILQNVSIAVMTWF